MSSSHRVNYLPSELQFLSSKPNVPLKFNGYIYSSAAVKNVSVVRNKPRSRFQLDYLFVELGEVSTCRVALSLITDVVVCHMSRLSVAYGGSTW